MRKNELLDFLESIFGSYLGKYPEYTFHCFKCNHHKKKLCINLNKKLFHCWVCDFKGSLRFLINKRDKSYINEYDSLVGTKSKISKNIAEEKVSLPKEYKIFSDSDFCLYSKDAYLYLEKRGLNYNDIIRYNIGYSISGSYSNRIIFPSFGENGSINYFVGRTFYEDDTRAKYKNEKISRQEVIFNEYLIDWTLPIILTEGVLDSIIAGQNAIPLLGSLLSSKSKLYKKIMLEKPIVYVALDTDAYDKSIKIIKKLLKNNIRARFVDLRPFNDINECGKAEFFKRLNSFKEYTMFDVIQAELEML